MPGHNSHSGLNMETEPDDEAPRAMGNHCRDEAENEGKFLDSVNQGKMGNPCRDEARNNGK